MLSTVCETKRVLDRWARSEYPLMTNDQRIRDGCDSARAARLTPSPVLSNDDSGDRRLVFDYDTNYYAE